MFYNYLHSPSVSRSMQSSFAGLNKNARIGDSEFADMKNMSSDHLPLLAPRKMRSVVQKQISETVTETVTNEEGNTSEVEITEYKRLNGILGDVGFAAVWGNDFYYMGKKVDGITLSDTPKTLLAMGAYVLIYPDTVYYNTEIGEYGIMETGAFNSTAVTIPLCKSQYDAGRFSISNGTTLPCELRFPSTTISSVRFIGTKQAGGVYSCSNPTIRTGKPSSFVVTGSSTTVYTYSNAMLSVDGGHLYYCSSADIMRTTTNAGYDKLTYTNCKWTKIDISSFTMTAEEFEATGFTDSDLNRLWAGNIHLEIEKNSDGEYVITNPNIADVITLSGVRVKVGDEYAPATKIDIGQWRVANLPVLDFVCVHENRLWGCRYGMQATGETVNEIYCSALGDFKTWTLSSDTATLAGDPYTMSVGEYGPFTGCISHRGYVLFFKDDVIYRVSGTKPANFQITKIATCGVQQGCEKSMEIIDEVLYYKSKSGIYAYDGSLPQKISSALGEGYYTDAVAGSLLSKYYIAMKQGGERKLYVYDTRYGVWHAEDDIDARFFTEYDGALYGGVGNDIVCLAGTPADIFTETESEGDFEWAAESGDIGLSSPYQKYYRRLALRMDMETGARVKVSLLCGNEWLIAADFTAPDKRSFIMPVVTPRCDHMRIRIEGVGEAKIYSISFETETVGDRPMR